jgi:DNA-binding NtrC family response regulator
MAVGPHGSSGLKLLQDIRNAHPDFPVIACTADASFRTEPNAQIADDVFPKGMNMAAFKWSIQNVLASRTLIDRAENDCPEDINGSPTS